MMKKILVISLAFLFIIGSTAISRAGGGPAYSGPKDSSMVLGDVSSYRSDVGDKAARGVKNILFGWTELPKRVVDITQETNNPFWGVFAGLFQGTLKAMARTASGVSDVVTAPIAPEKGYFIQPDINVE
jgi:putative exosortase-associated protein (TIGR04073 family)